MGVKVKVFESLNVPLKNTSLLNSNSDADEIIEMDIEVWREGLEILNNKKTNSIFKYTDRFFGNYMGHQLNAVTQSKNEKLVYVGAGISPESLVPLAEKTLRRFIYKHIPPQNRDR